MSESTNNRWNCPNCGTPNDANFCAGCGTPRPAGVQNYGAAPVAAPGPAAGAPVANPYMQAAPAPTPAKKNAEYGPAEKKKANLLCLLSLFLFLGLPVIVGIIYGVLMAMGASYQFLEDLMTFSMFILCPADIAGLVLMIVVRVKYRKSVFGKVLMVLYIVIYVLTAIAAIFLIGACLTACTDATW